MAPFIMARLVLATAALLSAPQQEAEYIGAEACAQCHEDRAVQHSKSPHGNTWRPTSVLDSVKGLPQSIREGETLYTVEKNGGRWIYAIEFPGRERNVYPIHSVIGGERFGLSFLFMINQVGDQALERTALVEGRFMLGADGKLKKSPGFPAARPKVFEVALGRTLSVPFAEKCLSCHLGPVEPLLAAQGRPKPPFLDNGVSCERCHGPGSRHVDAVAEDSEDLKIVNPAKLAPAKVMEICVQCHGGFFPLPRPRPGDVLIANQATAFMKSECYVQSGAGFSCMTCHDPHRASSPNEPRFNQTCLGCHSGAGKSVCPVNPQDKCVDCHMPVNHHPDEFELIDHWIRVVEK